MYSKPMIIKTTEAAEGVYMTGSGNCWTVTAKSVQNWNGSHNVFEVYAVHSNSVAHISSKVVYTFTFSGPVTDAYSEFPVTAVSGNSVTVVRESHANAYNSGDNVTFKVWVKGADEASTKALQCTGITWDCTHKENVQGGMD